MRIGINIDAQFVKMTGIQHSVDSLIHHLYLQVPQTPHELWAFASFLPSESYLEDFAAQNAGTFEWRGLPQAKFDVSNDTPTLLPQGFQREHPWLSWKIRQQEQKLFRKRSQGPDYRAQVYDIFHNTEPGDLRFLSYKPKKQVATVYDIATRRFPKAYPPRAGELWEAYWDHAQKKCAHILAISEFAKQECMEAFAIPEEKITVTPLAARASTVLMEDGSKRREILSEWEIDQRPFVLYAGTLEPRKNLHKLIKAFADIILQDKTLPHQLVLAGSNWERLDIELRIYAIECGIPGRVVTTGYISNDQLNALMSGCDVFAYISNYEGFGMPPLEAMVCGAPVVTSNVSSIPEVVGDAGIQVSPLKRDEIAEALHLLMTNRGENARRRTLSLNRAKEFTWERTARLTMQAYEKAAAS